MYGVMNYRLAETLHSDSYTPVGDVTVISLCLLMAMFLVQNYIHKSRNFRLMLAMLVITFFSSVTGLVFQMRLEMSGVIPIYIFRAQHYLLLAVNMFLYLKYLQEPLFTPEEKQKSFHITAISAIGTAIAVDIVNTLLHFGFWIDAEGIPHFGLNAYSILYALCAVYAFLMVVRYRGRLVRPIYFGLLGANMISTAILFVQAAFNQVSYTCISNFLLVLGIIFLFHSNPYDINTGAVSENYFYDELNDSLEKNTTMILISYNISNFSRAIRESKELKLDFTSKFRQNLTGGILYHLPNDRLVLVFPKTYDIAQDRNIETLIEQFQSAHARFQLDYKVVLLETTSDVPHGEDYIHLIEFAEQNMPVNTVHQVSENDIQRYYKSSYILKELEDIAQKKNLDDERVLVYCQPVYNILTDSYDTAEALMRLRLEKTGLVYPDQFIALAEQHGLIHTISMIILNKTCGAVRTLLEDGYKIGRISVNFSTLDIRYESFSKEVQQIIARNQIPFEKIAIEITESRSESDFNLMKRKVIELQQLGIKFYLDDFGTGYSNFERIMEIPFDIIKFDRSMLIESAKSDSSFYMVSTFANMFDTLKYSVLFEGIENDHDEASCVKMCAKYLQGYKYSRPIPIEQLCQFLELENVVADS